MYRLNWINVNGTKGIESPSRSSKRGIFANEHIAMGQAVSAVPVSDKPVSQRKFSGIMPELNRPGRARRCDVKGPTSSLQFRDLGCSPYDSDISAKTLRVSFNRRIREVYNGLRRKRSVDSRSLTV